MTDQMTSDQHRGEAETLLGKSKQEASKQHFESAALFASWAQVHAILAGPAPTTAQIR